MDSDQPLDVLRRRILEIVASPRYRPQKAKKFTQQLGLPEDDKTIVRRIIKKMVKEGLLAFGKSHLVHPARPSASDADAADAVDREGDGEQGRDPAGDSRYAFDSDELAAGFRAEYYDEHRKSKETGKPKSKRDRDAWDDENRDADADRRERKWKDAEITGQYLIGTFRRKPSGIGFVRLKNQDPENPVPDLYIAAHNTLDAASGDTVAVELLEGRRIRQERERRKSTAGRDVSDFGDRARILKVLERATDRFVGTFFERDNWGFVQVDGDRFVQPLVVGDPGATNARPGDKVVVEMIAFPDAHRHGEAVIVEVLGPHGVPGVDTLLILREYDLPDMFSDEALAAARKEVHDFFKLFPDDATATPDTDTTPTLPPEPEVSTPGVSEANKEISDENAPGENASDENTPEAHAPGSGVFKIPEDRYDATEELIITIDPADAKDFDDAVSLEQMDNGNWLLGVHIADVAYFVGEGGAIDREAKDRGTSVYLPDRVIPMLPEVLSNALASLQPYKRRLAKSVYMEYTPDGIRTHVEMKRSVIRSTQRFNYTEVQEFLDNPGMFAKVWSKPVRELLLRLHAFAMLLREKRFVRGAVEMNLPEVKIDLDESGAVVGAHEYPYYDSNRIIEECMLAANEAVAEFLFQKNILFLRRVHRFPSLKKMRAFADFVRSLNIDDLNAEDMIESRHVLQRLLDKVKGTPEEKPVNLALLRSMQRAEYSPNGEGHYALASECYCHFTSPIRRYPDLTVHRLIDLVLQGRNPKPDRRALTLLGEHCSDRERRAEIAENELIKLKLIDYLSHRIGMVMDGIVTGIESFGLFVQGIEIPAEGLVRLDTLTDDYYRFDRQMHTLSGARDGNLFRLGDRVRVKVVRADMDTRQIDFQLIERISRSRVSKAPKKGAPSGRSAPRNAKPEPVAKPVKNVKTTQRKKKGTAGRKKGTGSKG